MKCLPHSFFVRSCITLVAIGFVQISGFVDAQIHHVYYLQPSDAFFDIQGPAVNAVGDSSAPGGGFFQGNVSAGDSNTLMYIDLKQVFQTSTDLKLGDIAGFTYYTKKNNPGTTTNWSARIYSAPVPGSAWYQYRFDARQLNASNTDWTQWSANDTDHFYQINDRSNGGNSNITQDYTWEDIRTDPGYSSLDLLYFSFLLSGTADNNNQIAMIELQLVNGDTATLHLVPEPAHAAMGILFLSLLGIVVYRKRNPRS